jgi:hypothetical protein
MQKITHNFYLILALGLAAQAIFVVISGNATTLHRLRFESVQRENERLEERLIGLRDKIAAESSLAHLQNLGQTNDYVPITQAIEVHLSTEAGSEGAIASLK